MDNIREDLKETELEGAEWSHLPHNKGQWWAFVSSVKSLWVS
jgi:hypothetical protein